MLSTPGPQRLPWQGNQFVLLGGDEWSILQDVRNLLDERLVSTQMGYERCMSGVYSSQPSERTGDIPPLYSGV